MTHSFSNPGEYKKHSQLQYDFAHSLIKDVGIQPTDKILDIGCGDGRITRDMARMVPRGSVVGTDISTAMIQSASRDYAATERNLGFMVMNAEQNIFRNQFDVVTSYCCLHWVKEQLQALIGIRKSLVDNGKAILLVPLRHEELYTAIETVIANPKWKEYFIGFINPHNFFTKEKYIKLLEASGLESKAMQENMMTYEFENKRSMELFLKAWLPHMNRIPADKHVEFLTDISNTFSQIVVSNGNSISMPLKMLRVQARKPQLSMSNVHHITDCKSTMHPHQKAVALGTASEKRAGNDFILSKL